MRNENQRDILRRTTFLTAEYNPLHLGHLHQIALLRARYPDGYLVVGLSGDFVQRGEPAVLDKFTRAALALQAGADAVVELPVLYVLQNADRFAFGAAALADALQVGRMAFGSELSAADTRRLASVLRARDPAVQALLKEGMPLPQAVWHTLAPQLPQAPQSAPNAMLGALYLQALEDLHSPVETLVLPRAACYAGASAIRTQLWAGQDIAPHVPAATAHALAAGPHYDPQRLDVLTLAALRRLPLCDEALAPRAAAAAPRSADYAAFLQAMKTRNVTMARIKRAAMRTLLEVDNATLAALNEAAPLYVRPLAFRRSAAPLVQAMAAACRVPFVSKAARFAPPDEATAALFALTCRARDLYALLQRDAARRAAGQEFTHPIAIL